MRKKRKQPSYDIRPKTAKVKKPWTQLSSSTKSYWRRKIDVRPVELRRRRPLDRIKSSGDRAIFTQPSYRTPYQRRVLQAGRITDRNETERRAEIYETYYEEQEQVEIAQEFRKAKPSYGYDIEDFLARTDHPEGYSYVLYHLFYSLRGSGANGTPQVVTVRGFQYNTVEDVRNGWEDDLADARRTNERRNQPMPYIRTIVAVIPASGDERVGGAVYPDDYHPKERPGTREYEIDQGRSFLQRFNDYSEEEGKKRRGE